jgi:heme-degrading monooxygenase HmoA
VAGPETAAGPVGDRRYRRRVFADTPEPPYTAVIFTSRRTQEDVEGYAATAMAMEELARTQPGYLGIETVEDAATGLGLTVSYWATEAHGRAWKQVAEHARAQRLGRERWYRGYRVRIATVERAYGMGDAGPP